MLTRRLISLLLASLMAFVFPLSAEVAVPSLQSHVNDLTGTLTYTQRSELESRLSAFQSSNGTQIVVLIVPSTLPEALEQYSLRVVEEWKLGSRRFDNGVLFLIAKDDRRMRIEVGYGLEGTVTDATSRRIIDEVAAPRFKAGDFYGGISDGTASIIKTVESGHFDFNLASGKISLTGSGAPGVAMLLPLLLGGIAGALLIPVAGKPVAGATGGALAFGLGAVMLPLATAAFIGVVIFLMMAGKSTPGRYRNRINWVGPGSSSSIGSRSGSGGFRGGGGSFGGGGASGGW